MLHDQFHNPNEAKSLTSRLIASGVMIAEAAIATAILSFVATCPNPLQPNSITTTSTSAGQPNPVQVISIRLPIGTGDGN